MKSQVYWAVGVLFVVSVVFSACAAPASPAQPVAPTAVPATAVPAPATIAKPAALMIARDATLGQFLADDQGRTLYLFTQDTQNTSNCYDACATAWPPLLSAGIPQVTEGVNAALVGATLRKDGATQVTYNGYPLYYFAKDQKPGDAKGQGVKDVWYVITASGEMVKAATVKLVDDAKLGQFLADDQGRTLYLYTKDDKNVSNCYDACAKNWPPLSSAGQPRGLEGVNAALLGVTQRKDGSMEVTYNGYPLYYFAKDAKAGDTTGQGVGNVWYVISPSGEMVKGTVAAAPVPATPGAKQDTGYGN